MSISAMALLARAIAPTLVARCTETESGRRMIDAILTNTLLPELSRGVLNRSLEGEKMTKVTVGASADGFTYSFE
ncbi:hypothetical protein [Mesorhizobium waimense]|uniref:hypothetical protein n=1 Tax=Mesorhizobium waimense TaxID=1300307 RepID=UPI00142DF76E|nr:hypothetical protein [Mesorhizobium waimense]